jgi:hypothetical protein
MNVRSGSLDDIVRKQEAVDLQDEGAYGLVAPRLNNKKADRYAEKLPKIAGGS